MTEFKQLHYKKLFYPITLVLFLFTINIPYEL